MTIKELKKLFKEYLEEYHSDFSSSTIASYSAMAFFAYNHDIGFSLVDAMKTDVSFNEAKDAEKKHLESLYAKPNGSITTYNSNNIKKYLVALDLLKEFFDNQDEKGTPICMDDGSIEGNFYEIAKKIFTEGITVNKAVAEIRKVDKNYTNATCTMYFNSFVAMVNGEAYTRSLPYKMVDVFIRNIGRDFGDEKRRNALKATLEMLNYYYKKTGQPLKEHRVVCQKIADEFGDGISFDYKTVAFESGSKQDEELENGITDETPVAFDEIEGSFYKWLYEKVDNNTFSFYKSRVFMSINYYCFFNGLLIDRLFCCVEITDIKSAREYLEKDNNYKNDTVSKEDALAALNYYIEFLETHIINCSTESASDTNDDAEESIEWIEKERTVNEDESGSDTIDIENIEEAFFIWLKEQIDPRQIDSYKKFCADIEAFCKRTKLLNDSLFRCVDLKKLKIIRQQVAENKTYRFSGKVDVEKSVKAMRFYINFVEAHEFSLDESTKPTNEENKTTNNEVVFDSGLTILEAITIILQEADKPLTASEIYNAILSENLYSFGAMNPLSVVQTTIKRACRDIEYTKKQKNMLFGCVVNAEEKRSYYLLTREAELIERGKRTIGSYSENHNSITNNDYRDASPTDESAKTAHDKSDSKIFDTELISAAELIIPEAFSNGLRRSSTIARSRFNKIFKELSGYDLPEEINLDDLALVVGIEYDDKIYVPSKETKELIYNEIIKARNMGYGVVYYEEFYKTFASHFSSDCIFSVELLKKVMEQIFDNMIFYKNHACFSKEDSLDKDIICAYGNDNYLNYSEIKRRLPYADLNQIRLICSRDEKFVSMTDGVYALADRISISEEDIDKSKHIIEKDISRIGFSILNNLSIEESESLNPEISSKALKTILFDRYLSDLYSRKRSLISPMGVDIRIYDVMKDYCLGFEKITIEKIESYEQDISGRFIHGLSAAFDAMVRVDKNTFVHRDLLSFDIDATDRAIALYVKNGIYPLTDVSSFTSFPYIEGYSWNVFLLDSFCAHYSKKYRSIGGPAQKDIIGAIYPAEMKISSYSDLLAQVAADSGLELTDSNISNYFSKHKYLLRKSNINEVLAKAQKIRLREE